MQEIFAGRLFKTRGGAVLIGGAAAVLAAILLIVYLHSYRSSVNSGARPIGVLVAKSLIPRGTSGTLIAQENLYQVTSVPKGQLKDLAISDPAALNDRITAADIYPGQQLTVGDFTTEGANSIPSVITAKARDRDPCRFRARSGGATTGWRSRRRLRRHERRAGWCCGTRGQADCVECSGACSTGGERRQRAELVGGRRVATRCCGSAPRRQARSPSHPTTAFSGSCCDRRSAPSRHRRASSQLLSFSRASPRWGVDSDDRLDQGIRSARHRHQPGGRRTLPPTRW